MKIDSALLEDRRRELGLSMRFVAQEAGVSLTALANLERTGEAGYLTLNTARLIATTLALRLSDLLVEEELLGDGREPDKAPHAAEIGSALFRHAEGLAPHALAIGLGCSADEVERTLSVLNAALQPCGLERCFALNWGR